MKRAKLNLWAAGFALLALMGSQGNLGNFGGFLLLILGYCIITYDVTRVITHNKVLDSLVEP